MARAVFAILVAIGLRCTCAALSLVPDWVLCPISFSGLLGMGVIVVGCGGVGGQVHLSGAVVWTVWVDFGCWGLGVGPLHAGLY